MECMQRSGNEVARMNGDTAELLTAINKNMENQIKPLREDIGAIRTAVQDRGERLAKTEVKVLEASRGVVSNRYFIFILVITILGAVVTAGFIL